MGVEMVGFRHFLFLQHCFSFPSPPYFGISIQHLHSPHSSATHPEQQPHLFLFLPACMKSSQECVGYSLEKPLPFVFFPFSCADCFLESATLPADWPPLTRWLRLFSLTCNFRILCNVCSTCNFWCISITCIIIVYVCSITKC